MACNLELCCSCCFHPIFSRGRTTPMRNDTRAQSCAEILHIVWREILRVLWRKIFHKVWREILQLLWVILCILWGIISSGTLVTQGEETQGQMRTPSKGRALQAARLSIMLPGASWLGILESLSVLAVKELECSIRNSNMVWKSNDMYLFQEDGFMATYNK